jgi:hypothetical protein
MDDCIEFQGYKDKGGYGKKNVSGKTYLAHRLAYCKDRNIDIKDIDGLVVMHACDNPPCVNPAHLALGTHKDNIHDMVRKGRNVSIPKIGEANGRAKLRSEDVLRIREMVKFKSQRVVGKLFGISARTVNRIASRKLWAHLPEQSSID